MKQLWLGPEGPCISEAVGAALEKILGHFPDYPDGELVKFVAGSDTINVSPRNDTGSVRELRLPEPVIQLPAAPWAAHAIDGCGWPYPVSPAWIFSSEARLASEEYSEVLRRIIPAPHRPDDIGEIVGMRAFERARQNPGKIAGIGGSDHHSGEITVGVVCFAPTGRFLIVSWHRDGDHHGNRVSAVCQGALAEAEELEYSAKYGGSVSREGEEDFLPLTPEEKTRVKGLGYEV